MVVILAVQYLKILPSNKRTGSTIHTGTFSPDSAKFSKFQIRISDSGSETLKQFIGLPKKKSDAIKFFEKFLFPPIRIQTNADSAAN